MKLEVYDFPSTIRVWDSKNYEGVPYKLLATKELIHKLASEKGIDPHTVKGFRELLRDLNQDSFHKVPINIWRTTLGGMVDMAYSGSPSDAVLDLINNDSDFEEIRENNLQHQKLDYVGGDRRKMSMSLFILKK